MSGLTLSDTQLLILSAAAQRVDLRIVLPDRLRGGAGQKVLATLLGKALIEEILPSEVERAAFDPDSAEQAPYRISNGGLSAIGLEEDEQRDSVHDANAVGTSHFAQELSDGYASPGVGNQVNASATEKRNTGHPAAPRSGSKLAQVIELLARAEGASVDELMAATGWLAHTTRAALTGLRKRWISVERGKRDNGVTVYRSVKTKPACIISESEAA